MTRSRGWLLGLSVLALCLGAQSRAQAEDARALLRQGIEAFSLADFERSRSLLNQAATLTREASVLAQIHLYRGLNDAATGAPTTARAAFATALGLDPSLKPDPARVKREFLELFEQVRLSLEGKLVVRAGLEGARVLIDGRDRGPLPVELSLPVGRHRIEVRSADGLRRQRAEIMLAPERTLEHRASLEPVTGRLAVDSTPARAVVYLDGERVGRTPLAGFELPAGTHSITLVLPGHSPYVGRVSVLPEKTASLRTSLAPSLVEERVSRRRFWTWVALGGALASLGVGVGLGVASNADFQSYQDRCSNATSGTCGELRDSVRAKDLAANSLFGAAGALAIGSALLYYFEGRPSTSERAARVAPFAGGLGAAISGSF